jgi:membrane-associated phospholipid phosphatase
MRLLKDRLNQFLVLLGLSILGLGLIANRSLFIKPTCLPQSPCKIANIPAIDQILLHWTVWDADGTSFRTQALAGILTVSVLFMVSFFLPVQKVIDQVLFLATLILANVCTKELAHVLWPRARPFVFFENPTLDLQTTHYTSFYSGHTSFCSICMFFIFQLMSLPELASIPRWGRLLLIGISMGFVVVTGLLRIASHRHFLTDVLMGALMGIVLGLLFRPKSAVQKPLYRSATKGS